jgi:hypothetical protein
MVSRPRDVPQAPSTPVLAPAIDKPRPCPYLMPREVGEAVLTGGERAKALTGFQVYKSDLCCVFVASAYGDHCPRFEVVRHDKRGDEWHSSRERLRADEFADRYGSQAVDRWRARTNEGAQR